MIVDADKVKELKNLAVAFALLELPGQPRAMHMGTSYLVNQLMSAVESQAAEIERLKDEIRRIHNIGMMFQAPAQPSGPIHNVCKHGYVKACPVCDAAKDHS